MTFNEVESATPIADEELEGLIPAHVQTRLELNEWEHANIEEANEWLRNTRLEEVTSIQFLRKLHRKMFERTWRWAGEFRRTNKNLGVPKERIWPELKNVCEDINFWLDHETFTIREIAVRFHHRVVSVHPFANGNGRHSRLAADTLLLSYGLPRFDWGGRHLDEATNIRTRYITSLREADRGSYRALYEFVEIPSG